MTCGIKAWREKSLAQAYLALISAALLTSSKSSALPLLLCCMIALFPAWRMLIARPARTGLVVAICVVISFVPTALLNIIHTGDWSGYKAEGRLFMASNPLVGIGGNTLAIASQNLVPPFAPGAFHWSEFCLSSMPNHWRQVLEDNFETGFLDVREIVSEERAGFGLGNLALLVLSAVAARRVARDRASAPVLTRLLLGGAVVGLLAFMAKSGVNASGRLLAPYYLLLAPGLLLSPAQSLVIRTRWWRKAVGAVLMLAVLLLVFSPARPIWPALTVLAKAAEVHREHEPLQRAVRIHRLFRERADALGELLQDLPECARLGVISYIADPVASLWRPFGKRRLYYLMPSDSAETIRAEQIEYAIVGEEFFGRLFHEDVENWIRKMRGTIVSRRTLTLTYIHGPQHWYVVRFAPESI